MKFDVVIGNPPYNEGVYVDFLKITHTLLNEDGKFYLLVPNKIITPHSKGSKILKENYNVETIDLTAGPHFIPAIEGTWVCCVSGTLGTTDEFTLILPDGKVKKTTFDSPNPVMEMSEKDFSIHQKVMTGDNKLVNHKNGEIDGYFAYIRPTAKRVNNKLRFQTVSSENSPTMKNGRYYSCVSKEQSDKVCKILSESELFQYISYCNFGFMMVSSFVWNYLPQITDCSYNNESNVYDYFGITVKEQSHIQNILNKKRTRHH